MGNTTLIISNSKEKITFKNKLLKNKTISITDYCSLESFYSKEKKFFLFLRDYINNKTTILAKVRSCDKLLRLSSKIMEWYIRFENKKILYSTKLLYLGYVALSLEKELSDIEDCKVYNYLCNIEVVYRKFGVRFLIEPTNHPDDELFTPTSHVISFVNIREKKIDDYTRSSDGVYYRSQEIVPFFKNLRYILYERLSREFKILNSLENTNYLQFLLKHIISKRVHFLIRKLRIAKK